MTKAQRLTQKGQVTIPVEVCRHLGVGPRDQVRFEIGEDRGVCVVAVPSVVDQIFGSVPPIYPIPTDDELEEDFERALVEEAMGTSRDRE